MAAPTRAFLCRLAKLHITATKCIYPTYGQAAAGLHTCGTIYGPNPSRIARRLETFLSKKKMLNPSTTDQLKWVRPTAVDGGIPGTKRKMVPPHQSTRLKTYNKIVHDHLVEVFTSDVISKELCQMQVEIVAVRYNGNMTTCRVFWRPSGTAEEDHRIQEILNQYAPKIRHYLISHHVLGKIPQLCFVTEKASANAAEVERLLSIADMGPPEEEGTHTLSVVDEDVERDELSLTGVDGDSVDEVGIDANESLFGIDHSVINKKIHLHKMNVDSHEEHLQETGPDADDGDDLAKTFQQFQKDLKRQKTKKSKSSLRREGSAYRGELSGMESEESRDLDFENENIELDDYDRDEFEIHSDSDDSGYDGRK